MLSFIQQAVTHRDVSQLQQVVQQVTSWVAHSRSHPNTWPVAMEKQASRDSCWALPLGIASGVAVAARRDWAVWCRGGCGNSWGAMLPVHVPACRHAVPVHCCLQRLLALQLSLHICSPPTSCR